MSTPTVQSTTGLFGSSPVALAEGAFLFLYAIMMQISQDWNKTSTMTAVQSLHTTEESAKQTVKSGMKQAIGYGLQAAGSEFGAVVQGVGAAATAISQKGVDVKLQEANKNLENVKQFDDNFKAKGSNVLASNALAGPADATPEMLALSTDNFATRELENGTVKTKDINLFEAMKPDMQKETSLNIRRERQTQQEAVSALLNDKSGIATKANMIQGLAKGAADGVFQAGNAATQYYQNKDQAASSVDSNAAQVQGGIAKDSFSFSESEQQSAAALLNALSQLSQAV